MPNKKVYRINYPYTNDLSSQIDVYPFDDIQLKIMGKREFAEWLEGKFLSWMGEAGRRRTVTEFAKYIGVSQSLMSQWLNGHYLPDLKNINKIAERLGPEVYDLLN